MKKRKRTMVWIDPRFLIGGALVLGSIVAVSGLVHATSATTPMYQASTTLLPGEVITEEQIEVVEVRLGETEPSYIAASEDPVGKVATVTIPSGQLIPHASIASESLSTRVAVVVSVQGVLPASVTRGSSVDLWSAAALAGGAFSSPTVLLHDAIVAEVVEDDGIIADRSSVRVELLVDRESVAALLAALANQDSLSIIAEAS
ncbi:SAF domain-containing protein [Humidisolicoccus flavus]|uniref:SAF domain-containing protein n=1 Tax=Humidisolicoccus flavus TaxID=3111414 RepID=UPI003251A644